MTSLGKWRMRESETTMEGFTADDFIVQQIKPIKEVGDTENKVHVVTGDRRALRRRRECHKSDCFLETLQASLCKSEA